MTVTPPGEVVGHPAEPRRRVHSLGPTVGDPEAAAEQFGAAKTVADCFKYRSRVGLDVAIEALKDYRRSSAFDADALWHFAQVCRVSTVIRPHLEAVA